MGLLQKINKIIVKIIFINFGGKIEKNYFLCSYFQHISLCFYSNFDQERSLDVELNYASNEHSKLKFELKKGEICWKYEQKSSYFYDKYVNSTIMVDPIYWNSIGSWIPTHKNLLLARFLIRPILDPKFPLMGAKFQRMCSWEVKEGQKSLFRSTF